MDNLILKKPLWLIPLIPLLFIPISANATPKKPNILIIMSDDVGVTNISAYGQGLVGYKTPNIDKIAKKGMLFTDYYGEQSCTAGRSALITGQTPVRTGLSKVGLPGANLGLSEKDPTLAELLKQYDYNTGQFGKNHLGDRNKFLPTVHGFDEFYGNLYHLNAEQEPEHPDYPKNKSFAEKFGPRGILDCKAISKDNGEVDKRFGNYGLQQCKDTGPLTKKRMQTADVEFIDRAKQFMEKSVQEDKPFFAWVNTSRMHFYTHLKKDSKGVTGLGVYADGMVEHDKQVGELLNLLKKLKVDENTIVIYTSDNGPHYNEWPDGGISPFRGEKNTNWEGGYRVPGLVMWPGKIKPGQISNNIMSHLDWVPTLMAAAGDDKVKEKLRTGLEISGKKYKVYLDGYDFLPYLTGKTDKTERKNFFYFSDDGQLVGLRHQQWKFVFAEQRAKRFRVWAEPFVSLRLPKIFNLRSDPFERADENSNNYERWLIKHAFLLAPAQMIVGKYGKTFIDNPPRQKPAKFNVEAVVEHIKAAIGF